jgi:hypothetical protein
MVVRQPGRILRTVSPAKWCTPAAFYLGLLLSRSFSRPGRMGNPARDLRCGLWVSVEPCSSTEGTRSCQLVELEKHAHGTTDSPAGYQ